MAKNTRRHAQRTPSPPPATRGAALRPSAPSRREPAAPAARARATTSTTVASTSAAGRPWTHQHLLALQGLDPDEIRTILSRARHYDTSSSAQPPSIPASGVLGGRVVANLFFEDSTRTRMSFSLAATRLGARVLDLSSSDSSVNKGETIRDTAANVSAMGVAALVVRHRASGAAALVARAVGKRFGISVVNAGDGRHEHPTQGLLDAYTIAESFARLSDFDLRGLKVAIVGDVGSSRVARSDIAAMTALGAEVVCVGPPALAPRGLEALGCRVTADLDSVIGHVHAVNVLRIQFERHAPAGAAAAASGSERVGGATLARPNAVASLREYTELYGLSLRRIERMRPEAIILHPGPINRGVEMTAAVADGQRSVVLKQVGHGVAVRMAVLDLCLGVPREERD